MATTTLTNGIKIPERASRDWYADLSINWNLLDNHLGDTDSHLNDGLAPKATADASGNTITSTYATKTELSTLSDTVGTKANDADVVHIADAETITGAKTFSDTVTSADVVPSATDTYSLGSASVQYNGIYGKSYYYNGTQWGLDQANVWTASNTFTSALSVQNNGSTQGTAPTSNKTWTLNFTDVNGTAIGQLYNQLRTTGNNLLALRNNNGTYDYRLNFWLITDGTASFSPSVTDTIELGTSTNKWKTLNGINPGALSLPNFGSCSVITSDFTANLDKTQAGFSWTSSYTGWLYVMWLTQSATAPFWVSVWAVSPNSTGTDVTKSIWGQTFSQASYVYYFLTYFPVVAGTTYYFGRNWVRSTNDSTTYAVVAHAVFIPTLGNV